MFNKTNKNLDQNYLEWENHWKAVQSFLERKLELGLYHFNKHSLGIRYKNRYYLIYGATESALYQENTKLFIKAENKNTGKLNIVFIYDFINKRVTETKLLKTIQKQYTSKELTFLINLKDNILDYYKPNSIKFIMDI